MQAEGSGFSAASRLYMPLALPAIARSTPRVLAERGAALTPAYRRPGVGGGLPDRAHGARLFPEGADQAMERELMVERKLISSGSPLEPEIGVSRAVRVGPYLAVAGTAPIGPDGRTAFPSDVYAQTTHCLDIVRRAVEEAGGSLDDVIRTRIMLTDIGRWREAARAHGEMFGEVCPACPFVQVVRFIDPEWLVEVEGDCIVTSVRSRDPR